MNRIEPASDRVRGAAWQQQFPDARGWATSARYVPSDRALLFGAVIPAVMMMVVGAGAHGSKPQFAHLDRALLASTDLRRRPDRDRHQSVARRHFN